MTKLLSLPIPTVRVVAEALEAKHATTASPKRGAYFNFMCVLVFELPGENVFFRRMDVSRHSLTRERVPLSKDPVSLPRTVTSEVKYSDSWLKPPSRLHLREKIDLWEFVTSYRSASVLDSHQIPYTSASTSEPPCLIRLTETRLIRRTVLF